MSVGGGGAARPAGGWRRRLLIFAKEPRPGRVKTRLGRQVGMVEAAGWYRRQTRDLLRRLGSDPRWETWLAVSPDIEGLTSRFWPAGLRRWPQGRGDLGDRMGRAFRDLPPGPLVVLGADIPGVRPEHIAEAFRALGSADAAFGPATDGGYWLIGLRRSPRRAPAALFRGVRWSTASALADTEAGLRGYRLAHVAVLGDVDEVSDLPRRDRARIGPAMEAARLDPTPRLSPRMVRPRRRAVRRMRRSLG